MKKVLVHLHIYYRNQTDYFIGKLSNICGCEWDLYVTMTELNSETESKLLSFKPDAHIMQVENRGYDVWPFIRVLKSVDLDKYDYILKLHTKNSNTPANRINGLNLKYYTWRNELVDPLLKNKDIFLKLLENFDRYPKVGLMCSHLLYKHISDGLKEDMSKLDNELKRLGLNVKNKKFCAGTMFIARSAPYKLFQDDRIVNINTFPDLPCSHSTGSMAHVYERILTMIVNADGYTVKPIIIDWPKSIYIAVAYFVQPVLQKIFSIRRYGENRMKILTLFGFRFKIK